MEPINFIKWYPDNYCTNCKCNTLRLVTSRNNRCSFDNYNDNIVYDYIICDNCSTKYDIDWSKKRPIPLRIGSADINNFIYKWKK